MNRRAVGASCAYDLRCSGPPMQPSQSCLQQRFWSERSRRRGGPSRPLLSWFLYSQRPRQPPPFSRQLQMLLTGCRAASRTQRASLPASLAGNPRCRSQARPSRSSPNRLRSSSRRAARRQRVSRFRPWSELVHDTAIHLQHLAVDEAAFVGDQQVDNGGDIVRCTQTA